MSQHLISNQETQLFRPDFTLVASIALGQEKSRLPFRGTGVNTLPMAKMTGDVSAVSEANGTTVPVSLDLRSSLSIQPLEGSRSRVRRTRGAMGIQSISA